MRFFKQASLFCYFFGMIQLGAVEFLFEDTHKTTITQCEGSLEAPHLMNDRWQEKRTVEFDNGLGGYITSSWEEEAPARESVKNIYSGSVNLIHGKADRFYLIFPDTNYAARLESLWINKSFNFKELKKITSITVNAERKNWYSSDMQCVLVIALDDGTRWSALSKDAGMEWKEGEHILMIGNSQRHTFINVDQVRKKTIPVIRPQHIIDVVLAD